MPAQRRAIRSIESLWLIGALLACSGSGKSTPIGGEFAIRPGSGLPQDSHVPRALYYGRRQLAFDVGDYSIGPDDQIILYYRKDLHGSQPRETPGLYVFDGHRGTNAQVRD